MECQSVQGQSAECALRLWKGRGVCEQPASAFSREPSPGKRETRSECLSLGPRTGTQPPRVTPCLCQVSEDDLYSHPEPPQHVPFSLPVKSREVGGGPTQKMAPSPGLNSDTPADGQPRVPCGDLQQGTSLHWIAAATPQGPGECIKCPSPGSARFRKRAGSWHLPPPTLPSFTRPRPGDSPCR